MQTAPPVHRPLPTFAAVFTEQLGLIGRSLRLEASILGAAFAVLTGIVLYEIARGTMKPDFPLDAALLLAVTAFVMPYAIWRHERMFGQAHLSSLPVERRVHILIKALAGAVWIGGAIAWLMLWLALIGLIAGVDLGADHQLLLGFPGPNGEVTPEQLKPIRWVPQTWNWISAFTTGAIFYLLGSALELGVRHKLRWLAVPFAVILLMILSPLSATQEIAEELIEFLLSGPVGLDFAISGGVGDLDTRVLLAGQEQVAWTGLPSMAAWLRATIFWLALSGCLFWLAASRHKEA